MASLRDRITFFLREGTSRTERLGQNVMYSFPITLVIILLIQLNLLLTLGLNTLL